VKKSVPPMQFWSIQRTKRLPSTMHYAISAQIVVKLAMKTQLAMVSAEHRS